MSRTEGNSQFLISISNAYGIKSVNPLTTARF